MTGENWREKRALEPRVSGRFFQQSQSTSISGCLGSLLTSPLSLPCPCSWGWCDWRETPWIRARQTACASQLCSQRENTLISHTQY
ncbi:hypothetical protein MATL_G00135630 [Megalops atlanticus]|uniref:Uncharacterized protein n=1 Tax=Megalops atlanticus TaxID=7932 RepID=A0A9D3PWD4_MEGAT|nr:hypothetical protein MATL_G00135630 [Megalops atlanticus]